MPWRMGIKGWRRIFKLKFASKKKSSNFLKKKVKTKNQNRENKVDFLIQLEIEMQMRILNTNWNEEINCSKLWKIAYQFGNFPFCFSVSNRKKLARKMAEKSGQFLVIGKLNIFDRFRWPIGNLILVSVVGKTWKKRKISTKIWCLP